MLLDLIRFYVELTNRHDKQPVKFCWCCPHCCCCYCYCISIDFLLVMPMRLSYFLCSLLFTAKQTDRHLLIHTRVCTKYNILLHFSASEKGKFSSLSDCLFVFTFTYRDFNFAFVQVCRCCFLFLVLLFLFVVFFYNSCVVKAKAF